MAYTAVACNSFGVSMKTSPAMWSTCYNYVLYIVSYTILMLLCLLCQSARLMANKLFNFFLLNLISFYFISFHWLFFYINRTVWGGINLKSNVNRGILKGIPLIWYNLKPPYISLNSPCNQIKVRWFIIRFRHAVHNQARENQMGPRWKQGW